MAFFYADDQSERGPVWPEDDTMINIIKPVIETILEGKSFQRDLLMEWANDIGHSCMKKICELQKAFKFIVEVCIMQRNGAGLHSASACYWESTKDGTAYLRWENDTIHCIVYVFGLGI